MFFNKIFLIKILLKKIKNKKEYFIEYIKKMNILF